ncbi:MAG: hypothetical protein B6244_13850 [Candidatus Cloacimonetes bacterium 4572_55]|nr:MAG: hypothetical protein B6244_13850 [Candidatus Cloacimonetes bacterium 4572_55]
MHDPFLLDQMEPAVDRIRQAAAQKESIRIFGDTDVDGFTATAILLKALRGLRVRPDYFIPDRFKEGYGLRRGYLDKARSDGVSLMVTVDTGIRAWDGAKYAREIGIDLIITDHHIVPEELPQTDWIINPLKRDCPYPSKNLAGVAVALKLAEALLSQSDRDCLQPLYALAALGTISDKMPLIGENRLLVLLGLSAMRTGVSVCWEMLCQQMQIDQSRLTVDDLRTHIVPLLTSGRVSDGRQDAVELFLTEDKKEARRLISRLKKDLHVFQSQRRLAWQKAKNRYASIQKSDGSDHEIVVVHEEKIPSRFIGFCASKLSQMVKRPVLVIGDGQVCEARAPADSFNLLNLLDACQQFLSTYGGHRPAAGCTIKPGNVNEFIENIRSFETKSASRSTKKKIPPAKANCQLTASDFRPELRSYLRQLEPFGMANPPPIFLLHDFPFTSHQFPDLKIEKKKLVAGSYCFYLEADLLMRFIKASSQGRQVDCTIRYRPQSGPGQKENRTLNLISSICD